MSWWPGSIDISPETPHGHWIDLDVWGLVLSDPNSESLLWDLWDGSIHIGVAGDVAGGPSSDGDGNINILDIVKTIKYILGLLPAPQEGFALFVADPVDDGVINIQDLIWMIEAYLHPSTQIKTLVDAPTQPVTVGLDAVQQLDNGGWVIPVTLESNGTVAGLQATLMFNTAQLSAGAPYLVERAAGLTLQHRITDEGSLQLLVYSATGEVIPPGTGAAVHLPVTVLGSPVISLAEVILADRQAGMVPVVFGESVVSIKSTPTSFTLTNNAPNPFNPSTTIAYEVPLQAHITLTVYNLLGQEVIRLVDQVQTAGRYTMVWHGRNGQGRGVASGIYLYRLTSSTGFSETKRMTLLK